MLYYYIRTELREQEPSEIALSYDALRKAADVLKARKVSKGGKKRARAGDDAGASSTEPSGDALQGEWFDLAVGVSSLFL